MKILHTADWHIGQFKGPVVDGVNLRSQDTVNCLNYMIKVAEEEKPDIVCVSGDVFHQEQIGPVRYSDEMIVATDTITKLAGVAKAVIVMRGTPNHDGGGQFRVLSKMFANTGNVHIVTSPTVLRTPYADIACIPGFDKQEFRSRFPGLSADEENEAWTSYISSMVMGLRAECHNTSILMAHYTVPGCNMESGQTSFFTNFEPVIPREALEAAGYEAVLLGHIHRPQQINGLHNVYYSGAINAMNFNDEHQNRGFYIHEFMGGEMTSSQFCGTPYRRFKTIDWDTNQVSDYIGNRDAYALVTNISRDISDIPDSFFKTSGVCYVSVMAGDFMVTNKAAIIVVNAGYTSGDTVPDAKNYFEQLLRYFDATNTNVQEYGRLAERFAVGLAEIPESLTDNAKYYAHQAEQAVMGIPGQVEDAKADIDNYVKGKEDDLKGEDGNVCFVEFRIQPPCLFMRNNPEETDIEFRLNGSKLEYKWRDRG